MYTQCPDCATAFRVTADVLKQAAGKVRCGGCGHAFNALLYLSESRPEARPRPAVAASVPELTPDPQEPSKRPARPPMSAAQSAALLNSLDQMAGEDIRLEDTGVEWRLLGNEDDEANNDDGLFAGSRISFEDFAFVASEESLVKDSDGDGIEFSFGDSLADDEDAPNDVFADTNTPIGTGIFFAPTASAVDELLDDTPTPVDELLSDSPSDVDAEEVFIDAGAAEIDAEDVFAAPAARAEDVLRFDDNTGLPENFDFDAQPAAVHLPAPEPAANAEPPLSQSDVAFGDPDDWVGLLDEVEPFAAAAERDVFADTGTRISLEVTGIDAGAGTLTIAEELAALPDDEETADEDPVAAAGIDLSGIYRSYAPVDAGRADDREDPHAAVPLHFTEANVVDERMDDLAVDEYGDTGEEVMLDFDSDTRDESEVNFAAAGNSSEFDIASEADDAVENPPDGDGDVSDIDIDAPVAVFPASTGELEFELANAQKRHDVLSPDDVEFDPTRTIVPPPTEEEQTVNMLIDADLMRLAFTDDEGMTSTLVLEEKSTKKRTAETLSPDGEPSEALFETIIMEGAFARTAYEQERVAAESEVRAREAKVNAERVAQQSSNARSRMRRLQIGLVVAVLALVVLLAGQFIHQSRAELATMPAVGDAIAPIYRAVGAPIAPEWDVKGWRFEVTNGSTSGGAGASPADLPDLTPGDEILTIYSRLGNQSEEPLPYPLITLALTDRFEEVIGSKVLEPADYLESGISSRDLVLPGTSFDAVIAVAAPAESAAGFKLNVCYRHEGGRLRCALEDFR